MDTHLAAVSGPLSVEDTAGVALFRSRLAAANFTAEGVRVALQAEGNTLARAADVPVHLRRLAEPTPLATCIKLFILDVPVPAAEAELAFAPLTLARLRALGLLMVEAEAGVRAAVRIVPHDDLLIVSDRGLHAGRAVATDHVPGVQRPSLTLAQLTVRRPVPRGLDMGTGCGIQAILLARHCERVVASDVNPRALSYAAFNASFNGVHNIEFRLGSWFEPVAGERFDVVVANPPYVISPDSRYLFRDGGLEGDAVSGLVVRQAPGLLTEGGFATIMVSWIGRAGEEPTAPVRRWVDGSGCDAWLLHYATETPLTTAARWNEPEAVDPAAYAASLDRWLEYYQRLAVEGVGYGSVVLRRRSAGRNWVRADPLPAGGRLRPASAHILRVFAAHDHLAGAGDAGLLAATFAPAESARVSQVARLHGGASVVEQVTLHLDEGLGFQATVDHSTAELLPRLDGARTLRDALGELFAREGRPENEREEFLAAGASVVRRLYELGFLVLAGPAPPVERSSI